MTTRRHRYNGCKDNEKQKENNDKPEVNREQDNEDSSTTQEAVIDDGCGHEPQQQ